MMQRALRNCPFLLPNELYHVSQAELTIIILPAPNSSEVFLSYFGVNSNQSSALSDLI